MSREELERKLECLACVCKLHEANTDISEDICICRQLSSGIQIHYGIEIITETLGLELKEITYLESDYFPYEYYFIYDGVRFFQVNERKLIGDGTD